MNQSIYWGYMEKTLLNVKTDKRLKQNAQKTAKELGLPLGTIINAYLRELVREKRVIFSAPLLPNKHTREVLQKIAKDIAQGKNTDGPFSYEKAVAYLERL